MNRDELQQWLAQLEAGDEVLLSAGPGVLRHERMAKVDRHTPKQVVVLDGSLKGRAFWKHNGYAVGSRTSYIRPVTEEDKRRWRHTRRVKDLSERALWNGMTLEQLEQVWALACQLHEQNVEES